MTPTSMSRLRLVISAATGLLLIACIVVVWANPQPIVSAHTGSVAAAPIAFLPTYKSVNGGTTRVIATRRSRGNGRA